MNFATFMAILSQIALCVIALFIVLAYFHGWG